MGVVKPWHGHAALNIHHLRVLAQKLLGTCFIADIHQSIVSDGDGFHRLLLGIGGVDGAVPNQSVSGFFAAEVSQYKP